LGLSDTGCSFENVSRKLQAKSHIRQCVTTAASQRGQKNAHLVESDGPEKQTKRSELPTFEAAAGIL
jgi:hypothetical protein